MDLVIELITQQASLELNVTRGAQVKKLELSTAKRKRLSIIDPFDDRRDFFATGCFLMYPWVNRLATREVVIEGRRIEFDPPCVDGTGNSLHGLYYDGARRVVEVSETRVVLEPTYVNPDFPYFTEEWGLEDHQLRVKYTFTNQSEVNQQFAFGCHPYLTLGPSVDSLVIGTNMTKYHPLTQNLLPSFEPPQPIYNVFTPESPLNSVSLDHTLSDPSDGPPFVSLSDLTQEVKLTITSSSTDSEDSIPMNYLQAYTPSSRRSLAIEPMSAIGNSFVDFPHLLTTLHPGEQKHGGFSISVADLSILA